jgi:hypothetical protein
MSADPMRAASSTTCPRCGNALPGDAPAGLCPACLMRGALTEEEDPQRTQTAAPGAAPRAPAVADSTVISTFPRRFGDYELTERIASGGGRC